MHPGAAIAQPWVPTVRTLLDPRPRLRAVGRTVRPLGGALDNAREAVEQDRRALGRRREAAVEQAAAAGPGSWEPLDRPALPSREGPRHGVHLYDSDAELVTTLAAYVTDGLAHGETCVVIATAPHRAGLRRHLSLAGVGPEDTGRLMELDAEEVLRRFVRDGWPDPELFDIAVAEVVRALFRAGAPVRAFGEMVGVLHARGELPGALQLEKLWESLQLELDFPLLCAYPKLGPPELDEELAAAVCPRHSHLSPTLG